jgi:hypothetical protein
MGLRNTQSLHAYYISMLIQWAFTHGHELTFGDAYRDPLLAKLNSGLYGLIEKASGAVTWLARRGSSKSLHCDRLATDLNLFQNGRYLSSTEDHRALGRKWESLHKLNRWGGRYGDGNHYETLPREWRDENYKPL